MNEDLTMDTNEVSGELVPVPEGGGMERYWAWNYEIRHLGCWPSKNYTGHNTPIEIVKAADAQQAVERLERELRELAGELTVDKLQVHDLKQQVAQLQRDRFGIGTAWVSKDQFDALHTAHTTLRGLVREVMDAGVEMDDIRIHYKTVQIERDWFDRAEATLPREGATSDGGEHE